MATNVVFNDRALRKLMDEGGDVAKAMGRMALRVERRAKVLAPVRTGRLRSSIQSSIDVQANRIVAIIGTTLDYAAHVEYGTKPHTIKPKGGGVLAWKQGGTMRFAKSVQHPGTPAKPYLRPALEYVKSQGLT